MSTFETPRRSHAAAAAMRLAAVLPALATMLHACIAYFSAVRQTRRSVELLHRLSDWELKDIGLTRSDIPRVARGRPASRWHD